MSSQSHRKRHFLLLLSFLPSCALYADDELTEIVVTSERRQQLRQTHIGNIDVLGSSDLQNVNHTHIHELMSRTAGVWISRGSGQESLPSLRSPVLTGAGSCGAFLTLEDSVPSRPSGFCNVNQLFELNTEQAETIELIRGPGNALYGSNALHGTINVLLPDADEAVTRYGALDFGPNDFLKLSGLAEMPLPKPTLIGFNIMDDGGFRDASGYRQNKGFIKSAMEVFGGRLDIGLSVNDLDQQTAGFIFGKDSYKDEQLREQNSNPEAFRKADSQRVYATWRRTTGAIDVDIRPFLRRSGMQFLQHFLPGQPLEENGHVSAGVLASATANYDRSSVVFGFDIEWADVFLKETQFGPTEGSDFLMETRPTGMHYDFDVVSISFAPYVHARFDLSSRWVVDAGLRAETINYDYVNNMLDGNTRDDGTQCGYGGCLYTRPSNRSDRFDNLAPKFGIAYNFGQNAIATFRLGRGFRAPQMTELYRLQSGQSISDLDSEVLDSLELGFRFWDEDWEFETSVFAMRKRDSVFQDSQGYNVNGARSRHEGSEVSTAWQINQKWRVEIDGSYARHIYDFTELAFRGESFVTGNDVDTAPRWLGSAEFFYQASERLDVRLQWVGLGAYYLDAENQFNYPGHEILNFRAGYKFPPNLSASIWLNNALDEAIADRADYAFGNYRYFPGRGREVYIQLRREW